jgi:aminopeptidase N
MFKAVKRVFLFAALILFGASCQGQPDFYKGIRFSHRDTILGGNRPERSCFNVQHYELTTKVEPARKRISGVNLITFRMVQASQTMQLDLFENLNIDSIVFEQKQVKYDRNAGGIFIELPKVQAASTTPKNISVFYSGIPTEAKKAPWDGGFVWSKSATGKDWVGVACEEDGASLWYPCKDDINDEPERGCIQHIIVPTGLVGVGNGRFIGSKDLTDGFTQFDWQTKSTINNYNINVNVGDYVNFSDIYTSKTDNTNLDLSYWVLRENEAKAKKHFEQVKPMLAAYEFYLGKYPFWEDSYKLVETNYLGMEHQSNIAYGNKYMRGYLGERIPEEFNWDFIIVHESGHEYFGNALTARDHADLWLHEAFTTYLETMYVEKLYGKAAAQRYINSQRKFIENAEPITGPLGVHYNRFPDADMYYKGAWMLHTLRTSLHDDDTFFLVLKSFYEKYKYKNCSSFDFYNTIREVTGKDYYSFLQQYLTYPRIPTFVYSVNKPFLSNKLRVRYTLEANIYDIEVLQ